MTNYYSIKLIFYTRRLFVFLSLLLVFFTVRSQNPQLQNLAWEVSGDTIFNTISELSAMERASWANDSTAEEYIRLHFETLGYDTIYFQFWGGLENPNVIAEKTGSVYPDSIIVLGAHYDTYAIGAPGADDNASGSAGVMETARVLAESNFEKTIRFILFSGEETGLHGSTYNANQSFQNGENIILMINLDMISYVPVDGTPTVNIIHFPSDTLYLNYVDVLNNYMAGLNYNDASQSSFAYSSDHSSFWNEGYSAMFLIDCSDYSSDDFNHYIHTDDDIIGISANSQYLAESIVKTVVVSVCEYAIITDDFQYISSITSNSEIRVFPNPADDIIYLQFNDISEQEVLIQIISSAGTLIEENRFYSSGFNSAKMLDLSHYSSGIYGIKVITSHKIYTKKLIIQ